jgi:dihydroorotase
MNKLLVKGGTLIDPAQGYFRAKLDILLEDGLIREIGPDLQAEGVPVLDAAGMYISPGMMDIHIHTRGETRKVAEGAPDADDLGCRRGVTTVIEAGSTAPLDIEEFAAQAAGEKTRHYTMLGCHTIRGFAPHHQLLDLSSIRLEYFRAAKEAHPELVKGLKCLCSGSLAGAQSYDLVKRAVEIGDALDLPVMVHIGRFPPDPNEIVALLRKGDVVTHSYHGKEISPYEADGTPKEAFRAARARGVYIDVGHGRESFSWPVYQRAFARGFVPDSISTDIYNANMNGPVWSLAVVMSKLMALGMSLEDAVTKVTTVPAAIYRLPLLGSLIPGYFGDLTLFSLEDGDWQLPDSYGQLQAVSQLIRPWKTVLSRPGSSQVVDCDLGHPD